MHTLLNIRTLILTAIITAVFTMSCSDADTLGDEPPVEVTIQGPLTYENGVNAMLDLKCATCHAVPLPDLAPSNIVPNLDLSVYESRVEGGQVILGADSIGSWIFHGLLEQPVEIFDGTSNPRQMPLDYATQLTASEVEALKDWSELGSPKNQSAEPVGTGPDNGAGLYFTACAACHGDGSGIQLNNGQWLGPPLRPSAVTAAKTKSMWLDKFYEFDPRELSDEEAADIRDFILQLLESPPQ